MTIYTHVQYYSILFFATDQGKITVDNIGHVLSHIATRLTSPSILSETDILQQCRLPEISWPLLHIARLSLSYREPMVHPGRQLFTDCHLLSASFTNSSSENYSILTNTTNHTHLHNSGFASHANHMITWLRWYSLSSTDPNHIPTCSLWPEFT